MTKRAIVLGGGGARGPYQVGVWRALRELGVDYSIVTGTSVGALNGAFMVQGDYALAVRLWESLTIGKVVAGAGAEESENPRERQHELLRQAVGQRGLDVSPLADVLRENIDEGKIRRSPIEYGLVSARLPTFQPLQVVKGEIPEGELVDYMLASATWFPFFKAKRIGDEEYVDGAFTDNLPAELAVRCGAEEIIAVDLQGYGIVRMFREPIPVTHIHSHWDLGDIMDFDIERAKRNGRLGYLDGLRAYRRLEGNAYAFHPGETRRNAAGLLPAIDRVRLRTGVSLFRNRARLRRVQSMLAHGSESRFLPAKEEQGSFGLAVTTAAEITAELLGIPPDRTYTMLQLNRLILEAAREKGVGIETPPSSLGRRTALPRLYEALRAGFYRGGVPRSLWRTAALFPAEFVAANYVMILEARA